MKYAVYCYEDGTSETEVLEREEGENCEKIKVITSAVGRELSDERTGPDCDQVHEKVI